jgi:hypothetical protein
VLGPEVVGGLVTLADYGVDREPLVSGTLAVLIRPTLAVPLSQEPIR